MTREELILAHRPTAAKAAGAVKKRVRHLAEYEDLLSEAYIGVIEAVDSYNGSHGPEVPSGWISRHAFCSAIHYVRCLTGYSHGKSHAPNVCGGPEVEQELRMLETPGPGIEQRTLQSQMVSICLDPERSSERHVRALNLHFMGEMSFRAAGLQMGVDASRVHQLVKEAGAKVRDSLQLQQGA